MNLKETNHSYYCSEGNYFKRDASPATFETWRDFAEEWNISKHDDDYNHIFRFDILKKENEDKFELYLFFIKQRKGIFMAVIINQITESDMPKIEQFLRERWEYLKAQWEEFSSPKATLNDQIEGQLSIFDETQEDFA